MATAKLLKMPALPRKLGQLVDFIQVLQEEREQIAQALTAKDDQIAAVIKHLEANFDSAELNGARGVLGVAERKSATVPKVVDWPKLYAYIKKTGDFDLLHKRPTTEAFRSRWENKETVPGVEPYVRWWTEVKSIKKPVK
jgi:hypothetical protein